MLRTLESAGDLRGKRVLVRADLNVPLKNGVITDDGRIRASLQTIRALTDVGARVLVCSHLGRPDGPTPDLSLAPVAVRLEELLGQPVAFAEDAVGVEARGAAQALVDGGVAMIENLRFSEAETSKDPEVRLGFAQKLAQLADVVVSDGFGAVHRKHASVYELTRLLPSYAGLLIEKELSVLTGLTETPARPYTVVLGGSKVSDKLAVIENLLPKVDTLIIGGGMVFTVLKAQGYEVASSLLEIDQVEVVRSYLDKAKAQGVQVVLPTDIVVAASFAPDADHEVTAADKIAASRFGDTGIGLDIGPESAAAFAEIIATSATVFWNGPMGVFEFDAFAAGTRAVAEGLTQVEGLSVVGGGDSAAAVRKLGFKDSAFGHISTGGGASLEYLEGKKLPGLEVLND
jgi:phosphoglycerate kinase